MGSVIVGGARTPIGKLLGGLKDASATDLGGYAIAAALARSGVSPDDVDYVVMGQVLQSRHRSDSGPAGSGEGWDRYVGTPP
jgi:acetyl-CoA C-acetyltransferase